MNGIIETKGLTHSFGSQAVLQGLDLTVPAGSIFALLGPNGTGKTTTIKILMNIIEAASGEARVLGTPSAKLGPAEFQRIGYVSENQKLPEWMTLSQFLAYLRPWYPTWDDAFCAKMLEQFKLPTDRKLKHLSRGMKMKVSLLSSVAYRPRLLILDEPFSGLDPLARDEFIAGMLSLVDEAEWTILISSHDIEEVERLVDWVGFLENGKLRICETTASLQGRFRRVEATLAPASVSSGPPPLPPPDWLATESQSHALRFVTTQFQAGSVEAQMRDIYPSATEIRSSTMTLREIFVALARQPETTAIR